MWAGFTNFAALRLCVNGALVMISVGFHAKAQSRKDLQFEND